MCSQAQIMTAAAKRGHYSSIMEFVPFNRIALAGSEMAYISRVFESGHTSGNGAITKAVESELSKLVGANETLLTTNCTHALELSARILNLGPGDEVIVPSYAFVSTAAAFALTGAQPVFVDVTDKCLNIDVQAVEAAITPRTRAVCVIHYAGIAEDLDRLVALCRRHNTSLIEDNAHGLGGTFKGQRLGSFGSLSVTSFHETKNVSCGEGGALSINDHTLIGLAEILREKGTDRTKFLRGQVDKYSWKAVGSSWVMSEILAACLLAQIQDFAAIQEDRMRLWQYYDENLGTWANLNGVRRPFVPAESRHTAHAYFLRMSSIEERTAFINHLRARGVNAAFHYQALSISDQGMAFGGRPGQCPVSEKASETLVRLPLFRSLSKVERDRVVDAVLSFRSQ